jgi:nicotinate-nucleotide adenylyltransferase
MKVAIFEEVHRPFFAEDEDFPAGILCCALRRASGAGSRIPAPKNGNVAGVIEFFRRAAGNPLRLGILSGTFNPPTRAHLALARAALAEVDEVLFVLPRVFPHKAYEGASFEQRIAMLSRIAEDEPRFSVAATDRGLFIEIAEECRVAYPGAGLVFLCGRDAAERIVNWDYGRPRAFAGMLEVFELRVAARGGEYCPPREFATRILTLAMDAGYDGISGTQVRERIAAGERWEHLVPPGIAPMVRRIYHPPSAHPKP